MTMAETLKLETVAEGGETSAQVDILREAGCSVMQGFHFSRPLTKQGLFDFLEPSGVTAIRRMI
jgi:sensor c-di-GMP phosphodiesterase-like protein